MRSCARLIGAIFSRRWISVKTQSTPYNDGKIRRLICDVQIIDGGMISEDIQIGKKLKEAGFKSYLDIRHTCTHFGVKKYEGDYQYKYAETILADLMEKDK